MGHGHTKANIEANEPTSKSLECGKKLKSLELLLLQPCNVAEKERLS